MLRYYNDVLASMGSEEDGWEPFCYAADGPDSPALGDEWVAGFEQGVELWPAEWTAGLDSQDAAVAEGLLAHVFKPWGGEDAANATAEVRLEWLEASAQGARGLYALWREVGLPEPQLAPVEIAQGSTGGPGRNETCPCGSGKKYKKCCGAEV